MTDDQKCPMCGTLALRAVQHTREVVADDGTRLQFQDELMECSSCGERHYTHDQSMTSSRARAGVLRRHAGLLTPEEIRTFREQHDLSQAELETILQTGAKTVVRWEKGTVCQSRAADQLMRLLMLNPANLVALSSTSAGATKHAASQLFVAETVTLPAHFQYGVSWGAAANIGAGFGVTTFFDRTIMEPSEVILKVAGKPELLAGRTLATAA